MSQAADMVRELSSLPRSTPLQERVDDMATALGCSIFFEDFVDYSAAEGQIIGYRCPDGSLLVWFSFYGLEEVTDDMGQVPAHFNDFPTRTTTLGEATSVDDDD